METRTNVIVRYAETDKMGIVHHSNYPVWFEAGRTEFIKKAGIKYSQIEETGLFLPLIKLECSYKKPAFYEDELVIKTKIGEYTMTRISFFYEVLRSGENEMLASGKTFHVWTGRDLKPLNLKKHFPQIYELISKNL